MEWWILVDMSGGMEHLIIMIIYILRWLVDGLVSLACEDQKGIMWDERNVAERSIVRAGENMKGGLNMDIASWT
jgi:hypothetical protein